MDTMLVVGALLAVAALFALVVANRRQRRGGDGDGGGSIASGSGSSHCDSSGPTQSNSMASNAGFSPLRRLTGCAAIGIDRCPWEIVKKTLSYCDCFKHR